MAFEYGKLRGRIREKHLTEAAFARMLCMTPATLSARFTGKSMFTQDEIALSCELLNIGDAEIKDFFFTPVVKET